VVTKFGIQNCPDDIQHKVKNTVKLFFQLNDHWARSFEHLERFVHKYSLWLEELQLSEVYGTVAAPVTGS
jgi:hypothetical protein